MVHIHWGTCGSSWGGCPILALVLLTEAEMNFPLCMARLVTAAVRARGRAFHIGHHSFS